MVIQSNVLQIILEQDIPFVYPNHECTPNQLKTINIH